MQIKNKFIVFIRVPKYFREIPEWKWGFRFVKTGHSIDFRVILFGRCFSVGKEF